MDFNNNNEINKNNSEEDSGVVIPPEDITEENNETSVGDKTDVNKKDSEEDKDEEKKTFVSKLLDKIPGLSVKCYKAVVIAFAVICFALAIFRIYVIETSVESPGFISENPFYKLENTWSTNAFFILCVVCVIVALIIGIFSRKTDFWVNKRSNAFVFISSLTGFCMVGCSGFFVYRITLNNDDINKFTYISIILMLLTGAYFVMDAVGFISRKVRPFCYVGVVIFAIVRLLSRFLDLHDVQHVSSNEYHLVSLTVLLLFFTANARGSIDGKPSASYSFFGLISILFLWCYSLPEIYVSLYEPYYVDRIFIFSIIDATLGMYVLAKLLSVKKTKVPHSAMSGSGKNSVQ